MGIAIGLVLVPACFEIGGRGQGDCIHAQGGEWRTDEDGEEYCALPPTGGRGPTSPTPRDAGSPDAPDAGDPADADPDADADADPDADAAP